MRVCSLPDPEEDAVVRLGVTRRGLRQLSEMIRDYFGEASWASITTDEVNSQWVQLLTTQVQCRLLELDGLLDITDVGKPDYFVSHAWRNSFVQLVAGVEAFLVDAAEDTRVWIDIFAVNQVGGVVGWLARKY